MPADEKFLSKATTIVASELQRPRKSHIAPLADRGKSTISPGDSILTSLPFGRLGGRIRFAVGLLATLLVIGSASAAQAQEVPLPRQRPALGHLSLPQLDALIAVNAYFNGIRTLQGEFIQIGPTAAELTEGAFYFARPGLLRLNYYPPSELVVIANGETLAVEDRGRGTQSFFRLSRTPLALLLAQYTDLTSEQNVRDILLNAEEYIIVVLAAADDGGWLTLYFDRQNYELEQWVTTDRRGSTITFLMFDTALNQPVDAAHFVIVNQDSDPRDSR